MGMAPLSNSDLPKNPSLALISNMQLNSAQDYMDQDEKNSRWGKSGHKMLQRKKKRKPQTCKKVKSKFR